MNDYTYSILAENYHEIAEIAALAGVNWHTAQHEIVFNDARINPPSIALDKNYRGKSAIWAKKITDKQGNLFPFVRFHTFKEGGNIEFFDGKAAFYQAKERGRVFKSEKIAEQNLRKTQNNQRQEESNARWKKEQFELAQKAYESATGDVKSHPYWVNAFADCAGENHAHIAANLAKNVKRGSFRYKRKGIDVALDVLIFEIRNNEVIHDHVNKKIKPNVIGYQLIADKNLPDKSTNKIFVGLKKGGFFEIGEPIDSEPLFIVEGLKTGVAVAMATNMPVVICLDAGNMMEVAAHFKNSRLYIAADDDQKENGNTGIYTALKIAQSHGNTRIFKPVCNGTDYADLLKSEGLNAVKQQLAIRKSTINKQQFEITPAKEAIGKAQQLLTYVQKGKEKPHIEQACKAIADIFYTRRFDSIVAHRKLDKLIKARGFDFDTEKAIDAVIDAKLYHVKKRNCITSGKTTKIDVAGLSIEQIVKIILDLGNACTVDARPMATGKTQLMAALIAALEKRECCFVAPLVSIVSSVSKLTKLTNYEDVTPRDYLNNVAICGNSAPKFQISKRFKHFFFDEFRQAFSGVLINPEMKNRLAVFNEISAVVKNAENSVYFADADLNDETVDFIASCTDRTIYEIIDSSLPKTNGKTIHVLPSDLETAMLRAISDIKAGENVFIATDNKEFSLVIDDHLQAIAANEGAQNEKGNLLVHSDNKGDTAQAKFLADANAEIIYYNSIAASPVIQSGFSITTPHIDKVYGLFSGGTITPNVAVQSIARCRTVKDIYMAFAPQKHTDRLTDYETLERGEIESRNNLKKQYEREIEINKYSEFSVNARAAIDNGSFDFSFFDALTLKERVSKNNEMTDFANNVLMLAEIKGYALAYEGEIESSTQLSSDEQSQLESIKEQRIDAIVNLPTNAHIPDKNTAEQLRLKNRTTDESNALTHWDTVQMSGKESIDADDVKNLNNGKALIVKRHRNIVATDKELAQRDLENKVLSRDKTTSQFVQTTLMREVLAQLIVLSSADKKSREKLLKNLRKTHAQQGIENDNAAHTLELKKRFKTLNEGVEKLKKSFANADQFNAALVTQSDNLQLDADIAEIICYHLNMNAPVLAVNGMGNHIAISKQPIKTLANLTAKFGFDCSQIKQAGNDGKRTRIYKISINPTIKTYAENQRKHEQKNSYEKTLDAYNDADYNQAKARTLHNDYG